MNTDTLLLFKKPLDCLPSIHWSCSTLVTTTKNRSVSVTSKLLNDLQHWMVSAHRLKLVFICTKGTKTPVALKSEMHCRLPTLPRFSKTSTQNCPKWPRFRFPKRRGSRGTWWRPADSQSPQKNPPQAAISAAEDSSTSSQQVKTVCWSFPQDVFSNYICWWSSALSIFYCHCTVLQASSKKLFYETLVSNIEDKLVQHSSQILLRIISLQHLFATFLTKHSLIFRCNFSYQSPKLFWDTSCQQTPPTSLQDCSQKVL